MGRYGYYYQIDYVDGKGYANYIDTFTSRELKKAIKHVNILNNANACINDKSFFVLDKYKSLSEDEAELIEANITNAMSTKQRLDKIRKQKKGI